MISVGASAQSRLQIRTLAMVSILVLFVAACQRTSVSRRARTGMESERIQMAAPLPPDPSPPMSEAGPPEPVSESPPEPFEAWNKAPREETFWERIDIGGSVEVQGIWGKNLPYRRDHYGRTKLQLEASYPKESARMGVVIQSRRSWYP
ncbi:MAG TPA: hypothetical protein ENN74_00295 [Firmicutes bacterium]|nr:hypothetical protein [Bacillota bacterium]